MLKTRRQIFNLGLFMWLLLIAVACGNSTVFKESREFDNVSWNRFDIQNFEVPAEAGEVLDFYFLIRHHSYFPYDFVDVNITFYMLGGEERSGDYHFNLKDDQGNWQAEGMGELWDIELPIRKKLRMLETGICKLRIENKMTKLETPGIIEIGLLVKRSNN